MNKAFIIFLDEIDCTAFKQGIWNIQVPLEEEKVYVHFLQKKDFSEFQLNLETTKNTVSIGQFRIWVFNKKNEWQQLHTYVCQFGGANGYTVDGCPDWSVIKKVHLQWDDWAYCA